MVSCDDVCFHYFPLESTQLAIFISFYIAFSLTRLSSFNELNWSELRKYIVIVRCEWSFVLDILIQVLSLKFHFLSRSVTHSLLLSIAVKFTTKQFVVVNGVKGLKWGGIWSFEHVCVCEWRINDLAEILKDVSTYFGDGRGWQIKHGNRAWIRCKIWW